MRITSNPNVKVRRCFHIFIFIIHVYHIILLSLQQSEVLFDELSWTCLNFAGPVLTLLDLSLTLLDLSELSWTCL